LAEPYALKGENHPNFGKTLSEETSKKNILAEPHAAKKIEHSGRFKTAYGENNTMFGANRKGENNPMYGKPKPLGAGSPFQAIEVFDNKNNQTTTYDSIREAARACPASQAQILINQ
jgi:hypothetical protein